MPYEHDNELVEAIHQVCSGYDLPEIFAALVTVTVDNIHFTESAQFREKLEGAYMEALAHVSAVEKQFHGPESDPPDGWEEARSHQALFDELLTKIMYRLFVGDDNRTPPNSGDNLPIARSPRLKRAA
jgi:hypothetical protein